MALWLTEQGNLISYMCMRSGGRGLLKGVAGGDEASDYRLRVRRVIVRSCSRYLSSMLDFVKHLWKLSLTGMVVSVLLQLRWKNRWGPR